jgi:ketosteroid isomerase-like protein
MSEENVEIVRGLLDAWSRRKFDAILKLIHEDIEWHPALTAGGMEGTVYRGHRDIESWLRELDDVWAELSHEIEEARDIGEGRVLVLGHFHAVGRESGVPIDHPQGFLFTIDDGKVAVAWAFASQEQALEATGLRE